MLKPFWTLPDPSSIGGLLLSQVYEKSMEVVVCEIRTPRVRILGIDGPTNRLTKAESIDVVHIPTLCFAWYLQSDLKRETSNEASNKMKDSVK